MDPESIKEPSSPTALMREKELLKDAKVHTYKTTQDGQLKAYFFYPEGDDPTEPRSTLVFYHGGKWDHQMVSQFVPQALHFRNRGMVVVLVEYRVSSIHQTTPMESILDAQTLILWLRENHQFLGVDPEKVIACGAGSGAHIALCAAMHQEVEHDGFYDSRPSALILYSAIVDTTKRGVGFELFASKKDAKRTSPSRHVRRKLPPSIFYHGSADQTIPVEVVEKFCKRMRSKKNTCLFFPFNRGTHSFFNFNVNQQNFIQSLASADGFLCDNGFLEEDPNGFE